MYRKLLAKQQHLIFMLPLVYVNNKIHKQTYCIQHPPTKEKIRGQYENKIRFLSCPEKVFETFATIKTKDGLMMSYEDFMRAMVPYNYKEAKEEDIDDKDKDINDMDDKNKDDKDNKMIYENLMKIADIDGDGNINIYEYFLIGRFLQIIETDMKNYFQNKTQISQEEMINFIEYLNQKSGNNLTFTKIIDPRTVKMNREDLDLNMKQIVNKIFEGQSTSNIQKIIGLRNNLFQDILFYEFSQFNLVQKDGQNYITNESFAKSIISFLDHKKVNLYMNQLDKIQLADSLITLKQYQEFHTFINFNRQMITKEIQINGAMSYKKLFKFIQNLVMQVNKEQKCNISKQQIETFMKILDINQNGLIDSEEFVGIVNERKYFSFDDHGSKKINGIFLDLPTQFNLWKNKLYKIYQIILE